MSASILLEHHPLSVTQQGRYGYVAEGFQRYSVWQRQLAPVLTRLGVHTLKGAIKDSAHGWRSQCPVAFAHDMSINGAARVMPKL